ncbi:25154_t:CDS:1, partial [Racocetra persica]
QKTNNGPCSVKNCDKDPNIFRSLTQLAMRKANANGTIQWYLYLQLGQQVCNSHYMFIVENEPTHEHKDSPTPNLSNKLSFGDRIKKMTTVLYQRRKKSLVLDPKEFNQILESADSDLKGFFAEMCNMLIPNDYSPYNQNEDKKQIVIILYLMARLRNKHVNSFKLELALYLARLKISCNAINALSNARISVTYKTI